MGQQPGNPWSGMGTGWAITAMLIAGITAWGAIGWLADWLLGIRWLFLPIGVVLGAGGAIYLIYLRYGREDRGSS
jgi:ATP synthase protein I